MSTDGYFNACGRHVLITGAAKRVGAELVRTFAAAGARIIIHCNHSVEEGAALLKEIGGTEAGHSLVQFDLTDLDRIPGFMESLPEDLDILINNASVFKRVPFANDIPEQSEEQYTINFHAPVRLMKALYEHSKAEELSVVNMLDQAVSRTVRESFAYILSKKALKDATLEAALQLAPRMRVNGILPGPVLPPPGTEHLKMAATLKSVPMGRPVNLHDLAQTVLFTALNRSMTGSLVHVDCGQHLS